MTPISGMFLACAWKTGSSEPDASGISHPLPRRIAAARIAVDLVAARGIEQALTARAVAQHRVALQQIPELQIESGRQPVEPSHTHQLQALLGRTAVRLSPAGIGLR